MHPGFSVIIPTYNRAGFVTKAIESILRQTNKDHEIIVVDDGSIDATSEVLEQYRGAISLIRQQNAGVSAARNTGIRAATGRWIAFLDSDDEWRRDYLLLQSRRIEAYPRVVAHATNAVTIYPDGRTNPHFQPGLLGKFRKADYLIIERPFRTVLAQPHWYLQSFVIRRDVLYRAGLFNTELTIAEDLDVIARVSLQGSFGISSDVLVETYRRREAIQNLGLQKEQDGIRVCQMFESVYAGLKRADRLTTRDRISLQKAMGANRRALGNEHLRCGDSAKARHWYKQACAAYPSARSLIKYLASFLPSGISGRLLRK